MYCRLGKAERHSEGCGLGMWNGYMGRVECFFFVFFLSFECGLGWVEVGFGG